MTPLQQFIGSIWALLPGLAPYLVLAWLVAFAVAAGRLAVDAYNGEPTSMLSMLPGCLWVGSMLTLLFVLSEVRAKGLTSADSLAGMIIGALGSLGFSFSFMRRARRTG